MVLIVKKKIITLLVSYAFLTTVPIIGKAQSANFVPKTEKGNPTVLPGASAANTVQTTDLAPKLVSPPPTCRLPGAPYIPTANAPAPRHYNNLSKNSDIKDYTSNAVYRYPDWRIASKQASVKRTETISLPETDNVFYLNTTQSCILKK